MRKTEYPIKVRITSDHEGRLVAGLPKDASDHLMFVGNEVELTVTAVEIVKKESK